MKSEKKYVVLENLNMPNRGFRFWTTNSDNNTHGANGELWYKEVMFTDDTEEAISQSQRINREIVATFWELREYYAEEAKQSQNNTLQ